jgi:hypothetical protein
MSGQFINYPDMTIGEKIDAQSAKIKIVAATFGAAIVAI